METWSSRALRLLARLVQQGASFLNRQSRKLNHLAEQQTALDDDDGRASSGDQLQENHPRGQPPDHWLQKIEESEGPVQWIDHTEERSQGHVPRASSSPREPRFPKPPADQSRAQQHARESGMTDSSSENSAQKEDAPQQPPAASDRERTRPAPSPRFESNTREISHEESSRSQQPEVDEPKRRSDSGAEIPDEKLDAVRSGPMRLQHSSSIQEQESDRTATDERTEFSSGEAPESPDFPDDPTDQQPSGPGRDLSYPQPSQPAEASPRQRNVSEAGTQPSTRAPGRREARSTPHPPIRRPPIPLAPSERARIGAERPSSSPPSDTEFPAPFPDTSTDPEPNYLADSDEPADRNLAIPENEAYIPRPSSSRPSWPHLPDLDQIMRDETDESKRWKQRMRSWERRQRLDREQRGQLWSE